MIRIARFLIVIPVFSCLVTCPCAANPTKFWVQFSGQVTLSSRYLPTQSPFADFAVGTPFHGSYMFDYSLVDHTDTLSVGSGQYRRYFSPVRDLRVEYSLPSKDYMYEPPVFGDGAYAGLSLNLWGVGNDAYGQWDALDMRFHNYPTSWTNGPVGQTYGHVPASQFVNGLYPHSSFFVLSDYQQPLDALTSTSALFDLNTVFEKSGTREFSIRFTDVNDPNWPGAEQIYAVVYGEITALQVYLVPEPTFGGIATAAAALALAIRPIRAVRPRAHVRAAA